jgi:uncharacterized damage-inducible protein DinB
MNIRDVLDYAHRTVLTSTDGLTEDELNKPGVCGYWSVKDILTHLTVYEYVLVEALSTLAVNESIATPTLERWMKDGEQVNKDEIRLREQWAAESVRDEYQAVRDQAMQMLDRIPAEKLTQKGILEWYGADYDLEDFLTYTFVGHKIEHMSQINVYRDLIAREAVELFLA